MKVEDNDVKELRDYLLGALGDEGQERVEKRMLGEDDFFEQVLVAEDELVDDYLEGSLSKSERERFEKYFLIAPERRQKLRFAAALRNHVKANGAPAPRPAVASERPGLWQRLFGMPAMRLAAAAMVIILAGAGLWLIIKPESNMKLGLEALNKAIKNGERPVEARISGIDHAPYRASTRGRREVEIDKDELEYAESKLKDEVRENPGPKSRHALGLVYLAEGDIDQAQKLLEEARRDDPDNAKLNNDLGIIWLERGKAEEGKDTGQGSISYSRAYDYFSRAFELDNSLLEALFNRALANEHLSRWNQAEEDWRLYLEKDPDSKWAVEAKDHIKNLEEKKNRPAQSQAQLLEEFDAACEGKDDNRAWAALTRARDRRGNLIIEGLINGYLEEAAKGQRREAASAIEKLSYAGRIEYERTGDAFVPSLARFYERATAQQREASSKAREMMRSAFSSFLQGKYEQARELYSNAAQIFAREKNESEAAFAAYWIANSQLRSAPKQSLDTLQPLVQVLEEREYVWLLALSLNSLADAWSSFREFSKSLEHAERARELLQKVADTNATLRNLQTTVAMHQEFGDYPRSLGYIAHAFDLADSFPADPQEVWTFYHLAALNLYLLNLPRSAAAFQKEALELAVLIGRPIYKQRSYAQLGLIYARLKNGDEAINNGRLALAVGQAAGSEESRNNLIANSTLNLAQIYRELGEMGRSLELYNEAIAIHSAMQIEIYTFRAHQGKLLALMGLNDDAAIEEHLNAAIPLIEQYRPKIQEESYRNGFFDLAQSIYDIAIDFFYTRRGDSDRAYEYVEASHARSWLDLIGANAQVIRKAGRPDNRMTAVIQPLTLDEIRRSLPDRSQVLEYAVLEDKVIAWVGSENGFSPKEKKIAASELNRKVERFRELIPDPREEAWPETEALAQELYEILIKPVEPLLDSNARLCIVPDKILHRLPFGALISPDSKEYFIKGFRYVLSPSANISIKCSDLAKQKEGTKRERAMTVGNPFFDRERFHELELLPAAAEEAEQVASYYDPGIPLIGARAREADVKAAMSQADVLHFASHYVIDHQSWMESRLLLTKEADQGKYGDSDGELQAFEIYNMRLPRARVAVLSACDTGIEQTYRGEGPISMARPFIKAGVPIVVASLWAVESDSTAKLMTSFHKHRKQGRSSTIEALREAQLEMLSSPDIRNHHPYRWASFNAIGGYTTF
jgi:CHAT domain-containing protein/lipoprotein NlpI